MTDVAAYEVLRSSEPFSVLEDRVLKGLSEEAQVVRLAAGRVVVREGTRADSFLVLARGRLRVVGGEGMGGEIGPGEVVGEIGLLSGSRRSSTVRAVRDSELVSLAPKAVQAALSGSPSAALTLAGTATRRLRSRAAASGTRPRTVAVIGTGVDRRGLEDFTVDLAATLGRHCVARVATAPAMHAALGGGASPSEVAAWLAAEEARADVLVYNAEAGSQAWMRCGLRQADRVVLVTDGDGRPTSAEPRWAAALARATGQQHLVVLRRQSGRPAGTAQLLDAYGMGTHHHVAGSKDMQRLARQLSGESVGLVLGGGGAKGFAHLGVYRALLEVDIPIDAVGGTSIGAIMGAGVALGLSPDDLEAACNRRFVETRRLIGLTAPAIALSSSRRLTALLRDFFGDADIEDLPIPYFCISADLTTGSTVVHDRGPLWRAVRASIAIPGILPPVTEGDHLLVDGGVLDDLPVTTMRARGVGHVVAVDLSTEAGLRTSTPFAPTISGWRALARRVRPRAAVRPPSLVDILQASKQVAVRAAQPRGDADLVLRPPVDGCRPMDFRHAPVLIGPAYQYTQQALAGAFATASSS